MSPKWVVGMIVVGAISVAVAVAGASGGAVRKPVAYLHVDARLGCVQETTCKILPPWMQSLRNPMDVVLFADGTLYYKARVITVGRPGAGPRRCDRTLFSRPFSGLCNVSDFGVGFVRKTSIPGPYKGPDIWVVSESARVGSSTKEIVNAFAPYPADTGNPALPGHYTIDRLVSTQDIQDGEALTIDVEKVALP